MFVDWVISFFLFEETITICIQWKLKNYLYMAVWQLNKILKCLKCGCLNVKIGENSSEFVDGIGLWIYLLPVSHLPKRKLNLRWSWLYRQLRSVLEIEHKSLYFQSPVFYIILCHFLNRRVIMLNPWIPAYLNRYWKTRRIVKCILQRFY